jgi:agmatine deiminase
MAFPWDGRIWGSDLAAAQKTFIKLIRAVSSYERVCLLVSPAYEKASARQFRSSDIEVIPAKYNDIWVRDTLPTFAVGDDSSLVGIDWHFNGWGKSRGLPYREDLTIARTVARMVGAVLIDADVTAEGGAFAFDGHDLIVATQSVMLHSTRNGTRDQGDLQKALLQASRCNSICWLPGDKYEPVSRGHADAILAFAEPNIVLFHWIEEKQCPERQVCERNLKAFRNWMEQAHRRYEIIKLPSLPCAHNSYCVSYVNFSHVNGAVVVPQHGGRHSQFDDRARGVIEEVFGKKAISVHITAIAAYGGGIHCATQHEPTAPKSK